MPPVYKLKFFDFMGIAEPIRYLFAFCEIPYENIIVDKADWIELKKSVPFGKLPVLEVDDKVLYQSVVISRYIGNRMGLVPDDEFEAAELDAIAATIFDFGARVRDYHADTNDSKALMEKYLSEKVFPRYLCDFDGILNKKGGHFGGHMITWVDIYFVGIMDSVEGMWGQGILEQYPLLNQLYRKVHNCPKIKEYVSKRPNYKF